MKSLIYGLLLIPTMVMAQLVTIQKPVECGETKLILSLVVKEYKETPIFILNSDVKSKIALTANHQTKSWTLLEFNTEIACILATGEDFDMKTINVIMRRRNSAM